ncbi:hypothetical protein ABKN59_004365 [Abortiporus biennis]
MMSTAQRKQKPQLAGAKGTPAAVATTPSIPFFPFARYYSLLGVHTSLLAFTGLFLPRTRLSFLIDQTSSSPETRNVLTTLTENPPRTLGWICLGAFILQIWWSNWVRGWLLESRELQNTEPTSGDRTDQKLKQKEWNSGKLNALFKASVTTLAASVVFHVVILLFGAPLNSHYLHTYLLALLTSLLTVFTPSFALGPPTIKTDDSESLVRRMTWIRLFAELSPRSPVERAIVYPSIGAFLGCWVGAIPLGLDWERPWQAWPLTPAYGILSGYIIASLCASATSGITYLAQADIYLTQQQQLEKEAASRTKPRTKSGKKSKTKPSV